LREDLRLEEGRERYWKKGRVGEKKPYKRARWAVTRLPHLRKRRFSIRWGTKVTSGR